MFPTPSHIWKCKKCGKTISSPEDEDTIRSAVPPKCPECDGEMKGEPIVKGGPFPKNPFRKD